MSQHTKDTAKAWGLTNKEAQHIFDWVGEKIEPHRRGIILTSLLRRNYKLIDVEPTPVKLTKEYIESKRHTRVQLAAWGIPWPPPKGWKKRLIKENPV